MVQRLRLHASTAGAWVQLKTKDKQNKTLHHHYLANDWQIGILILLNKGMNITRIYRGYVKYPKWKSQYSSLRRTIFILTNKEMPYDRILESDILTGDERAGVARLSWRVSGR